MDAYYKIYQLFNKLIANTGLDYSPKTIKAYDHVIKNLLSFLEKKRIQKLNDIDLEILKQFILFKANKQPYQLASINQRIAATELFFTWAHENGYCRDNILLMFKKQRIRVRKIIDRMQPVEKIKANTLTVAEQEKLLIYLSQQQHNFSQIRDACMIALILTSAIYAEELINLDWHDLRIREKTLQILIKGKRERKISVNNPTLEPFLSLWLTIRSKTTTSKNCNLLFFTSHFKPITKALLYQQISSYLQKAGIQKSQLGPDILRQTAIFNMLKNANVNDDVQTNTGHKYAMSLQRYL